MFLRASRGESTWNGDEYSFLFGGEVRNGDGLELVGRVEVGERGVRELVTDGDGGGDLRSSGESQVLRASAAVGMEGQRGER